MANPESDFYRRPAAKEVDTTTEKHERLTAAIAANSKIIADVDNAELDRLGHKLADLATAVQLLRELTTEMNLPELEQRLASIASALKIISDNDVVKELKAS